MAQTQKERTVQDFERARDRNPSSRCSITYDGTTVTGTRGRLRKEQLVLVVGLFGEYTESVWYVKDGLTEPTPNRDLVTVDDVQFDVMPSSEDDNVGAVMRLDLRRHYDGVA